MSEVQFGCELQYEVLVPTTFLFRIGCGQDAANVPFASLLGAAVLKSKSV